MSGPRAIFDRIQEAKRAAIKGWLLDHPQLTVDELIALREELGDALGSLSIAELLTDTPRAKRGRGNAARKAKRAASARHNANAPASANVGEREAMILAELGRSDGWVKPQTLVASTGVNSLTLRRALKSLEAQKKVRRKGRARGTLWRAM